MKTEYLYGANTVSEGQIGGNKILKEKFRKLCINVGTKFLLIIVSILVLSLNLVAKESRSFDFDSPQTNKVGLIKQIDSFENMVQLPESNRSISEGIIDIEKGVINQSGQEIEVESSLNPNGNDKTYYKFKPSTNIYWKAGCSASSGYYTVCATYKFYPKYGGHAHTENIPGYTWQGSGNTVPIRSCAYNRPVNTTVTWYVKTPEFATRSEETIEYFGVCTSKYYDTVDIKIDGLELLKPAHEDSLHGGATYYVLVGTTTPHPTNHFAKPQTITLLKEIAWQYHVEFPTSPVLHINDISLRWGGLFDVKIDGTTGEHIPWVTPHTFHRYGRQADLRLWTIPSGNRVRFIKICSDLGVEVELHGKSGPLNFFEYSIWENTDFNLLPWDSFSEKELDMRVPHYHLVFPKYDSEVDNPIDQEPQGCP